MNTLSLLIFSFCVSFFSFAQQGTLNVNVEKTNTLEGKVYIGLYTESNFLNQPLLSSTLEMKETTATAVFDNLKHGTYAIAAYQDVNGNEILDRDEYGRPTEPWVLSGIPASMMPIWMDSKFDFNESEMEINLKI